MNVHHPIPLFHLITSLNQGGAETMLCQVLEHTDRERFAPQVISLRPESALSDRVRAAGVPLHHLNMKGWKSGIAGWKELRRLLRTSPPAIMQTWMYHANLMGSLGILGLNPAPRLVWNITSGAKPKGTAKPMSRLLCRALAPLAWFSPDTILVCAHSAIRDHAQLGYSRRSMVYQSNGIDCDRFQPNAETGREVRAALGIPYSARVIGISARHCTIKDYTTFFAAVRAIQTIMPDLHFIACGGDVDLDNPDIARELATCPAPQNVHLMGPRSDMERIYRALDLVTLSSQSEAQPLSLCEGLASGLPCVATDVGDCSDIIGPVGGVVPKGNGRALAEAWVSVVGLSDDELDQLKLQARERALSRFALPTIVSQYESVYSNLLNKRGSPPAPMPPGRSIFATS